MKFRAVSEGLEEDAQSITPYLYDTTQGILPRIGTKILSGYSYTNVGFAGHSRGGGVLAHAFTSNILADGDYSAVAFIDPVVANPAKDVPNRSSWRRPRCGQCISTILSQFVSPTGGLMQLARKLMHATLL